MATKVFRQKREHRGDEGVVVDVGLRRGVTNLRIRFDARREIMTLTRREADALADALDEALAALEDEPLEEAG